HLERDLSRHPLFQVMLVLQNAPLPTLRDSRLILTPIDVDTTTSSLDLALFFREMGHELHLRAEYSTDLFDAATIQRLLGHLQVLLAGIVADPHRRINALPMLSEDERRQLLVDWTMTQAASLHHTSIQALFDDQVERRPDAVALVDAQMHL